MARTFQIGGVTFIGSSHEEAQLRALHEASQPKETPMIEPPAPDEPAVPVEHEGHEKPHKIGAKKK